MNSLIKKIIKKTLLIIIFITSACSTYWKNPNGREWSSDLNTCNNLSTFNQCFVTPAKVDTNCVNDGMGQTRCSSVSFPETKRCQNAIDELNRDSCLRRFGWRQTDKDGNYKNEADRQEDIQRKQLDCVAKKFKNCE